MNSFPSIAGGDGSGGGITVLSENIFNSVADRDAYFADNAPLLLEGVQCTALTNPPEGLYHN